MQVTFVGSGDAFGSGGRFNTCFRVTSSAATILIDCGASSLIAMNRLGIDRNSIGAIILSHLHGDHFGGLPFFLLECQFVSRRKEPLIIAGPPGLEPRVRQICEAMFPGSSDNRRSFEVHFIEITPHRPLDICGFVVESLEVIHPSGAPSTGLRLAADGKLLAYSGDTEWTDSIIDIARDADLFICECYTKDTIVPYHLNHRLLMEKRPLITARRMILTHMSSEMLLARDDIETETAEDGLVLTV